MAINPDSDTLILLDLTGSSPVPTDTIKDYSNFKYDLTLGGKQFFVTGPGTDVKFARAFEDQSTTNTQSVSDTVMSGCRGQTTVETWLWPKPGHNGMTLINFPRGAPAAETLAADFTGRFHLQSDNTWDFFWETGGGTNVTVNSVNTANSIKNGQWNHIAIVRKFGATSTDIEFYTNGNLDDTVTNVGNMPSTGSGADLPYISIGNLDGGSIAEPIEGAIYSLRLSDIPRSGSEISASANRTDRDHPNDSNTIGLWKMDEQPSFENRGNLDVHFSVATPSVLNNASLTVDDEGAIFIDNGSIEAPNISAEHIAPILTSSNWTIDFWYRPVDTAQEQTFIIMGASGETLSANVLFKISLNSSYNFTFFAERDSGVDIGDGNPSYTTTASLPVDDRHNHNHFALRKVKTGNNIYLDFFHNGTLFETTSGSALLQAENGGTAGTIALSEIVGSTDTIVISQLRLTKRQLTNQEILSTFQTGTTSSATQTITIFRALSGSQYVFFRSDEEIPAGVQLISIVGSVAE